jgi:hypothetical protein
LRARLKYESNDHARTQLESVLDSKTKQLEALQALDARLAQSKQRFRDHSRALSALCDRVQVLTSQEIAAGQVEQVEQELTEQLAGLNQLTLSISDAYGRV